MNDALLYENAILLLRVHDLPIMAPLQCHRGVQVGGRALQGQPVAWEHHLPLGWDELEQW